MYECPTRPGRTIQGARCISLGDPLEIKLFRKLVMKSFIMIHVSHYPPFLLTTAPTASPVHASLSMDAHSVADLYIPCSWNSIADTSAPQSARLSQNTLSTPYSSHSKTTGLGFLLNQLTMESSAPVLADTLEVLLSAPA